MMKFFLLLVFLSLIGGYSSAQTASQLVQIYLAQNSLVAQPGQYQTCMPSPQPVIGTDGLCQWDTALGAQPTVAQLQALIPAYQSFQASIATAKAAQAQYGSQLLLGLVVTCAPNATVCTSSIVGTYPIQPSDQFDIASNRLSILADGDQANGQTTMPWIDTSGVPHTFTLQQFTEFSTAAKIYVTSMKLALATLSAGGSATFPSNTVTLN